MLKGLVGKEDKLPVVNRVSANRDFGGFV